MENIDFLRFNLENNNSSNDLDAATRNAEYLPDEPESESYAEYLPDEGESESENEYLPDEHESESYAGYLTDESENEIDFDSYMRMMMQNHSEEHIHNNIAGDYNFIHDAQAK